MSKQDNALPRAREGVVSLPFGSVEINSKEHVTTGDGLSFIDAFNAMTDQSFDGSEDDELVFRQRIAGSDDLVIVCDPPADAKRTYAPTAPLQSDLPQNP